jgi:hypothetical protein
MNLEKLLAENMIRFGVKNLSESDKHRLMEAPIDLLKTQLKEVAAATKFFKTSFAKQVYSPTYLFTNKQYYLTTTKPYDPVYHSGTDNAGGLVLSFIIRRFVYGQGQLFLPILNISPDGLGQWSYSAAAGGKFTLLTFDQPNIASNPVQGKGSGTAMANQIANFINYSFNQISDLATIEAMYTATSAITRGPGFMINANKEKFLWLQKIKPLLTGNAKAFFSNK